MDHEAMRAAYLRALNYEPKNIVNSSFCNICKTDHNSQNGEVVDVVTLDTIYKIWYCSDCIARESEYV